MCLRNRGHQYTASKEAGQTTRNESHRREEEASFVTGRAREDHSRNQETLGCDPES
jgi:hypothetical protein